MNVNLNKNNIEYIIKEFKKEVETIAGSNLKKIILFGSYARGSAEEESDIDLLLIFKKKISSDLIMKIKDVSNTMSLKYDVFISKIFFSEEEFQEHNTPFLLNIKKEGMLV